MNREKYPWIYDVIFLLVLVLAGYLRLTGVNWGEGQGQHPDENTFSGVLGALRAHKCADELIPIDACPVEQQRWIGIGDYFNSQTSTLNPYNRGYGSYVYGDLPMILIRVAAEATNQVDHRLFGRQASALADLLAIVFLYFIVARLYNRRIALLASLFSSLAVMQIQQSHFFTTDLFVNTFEMLTIWFAVAILDTRYSGIRNPELATNDPQAANKNPQITHYLARLIREPLFLLSVGFGVAYGMALSSKVNIFPLAVLLPGAFALRYFITDRKVMTVEEPHLPIGEGTVSVQSSDSNKYWMFITLCAIIGGLAAILSFRVFQPYAFDGLKPDPRWVADIQQQRGQATGEADMPWNLQWARRSHLYSFTNLTVWGLGFPLGILAWAGFLYMGWRILKGEWRHALLWGWTAAYFLWQSLQFNPTMRYQLPIYPLLAMMAAWFLFELAGSNVHTDRPATEGSDEGSKRLKVSTILAAVLGITVITLTAIWAFAFKSIYTRDEPRIAASRWIFQNIPGPINVQIKTADGETYSQPLAFPTGTLINSGLPYSFTFIPAHSGQITGIFLPH